MYQNVKYVSVHLNSFVLLKINVRSIKNTKRTKLIARRKPNYFNISNILIEDIIVELTAELMQLHHTP